MKFDKCKYRIKYLYFVKSVYTYIETYTFNKLIYISEQNGQSFSFFVFFVFTLFLIIFQKSHYIYKIFNKPTLFVLKNH